MRAIFVLLLLLLAACASAPTPTATAIPPTATSAPTEPRTPRPASTAAATPTLHPALAAATLPQQIERAYNSGNIHITRELSATDMLNFFAHYLK